MAGRTGFRATSLCLALPPLLAAASPPLVIDTQQVGQTFHGIGGISGGGATSRLLYDYVEPQRSEILDYLFKPNYGASLQILKVEIGGDSQSTDGTEPSHMHSVDDLDYHRGYEWWLLAEAKKRNPEIKTYGLPWAFPGWVGGPEASNDPFKHPELTSDYMVKWVRGARSVYGVEIDYLGIWNERASDGTFVKTLKKSLDDAGFQNITLVAKDGYKDICDEMAKDPGYAAAVGVVGLHYPSDYDDYNNCRKLGFGVNGKRGGKPIWASEESSSYDDVNGAACWARVIMSHWVLQGFTSSIMWNLVGSYFHGTNWDASSMFTAKEPWSGHYGFMAPLWATAHVTQFTKIGWDLIEVGSGSGELPKGGFYATYADPASGDWTLTISKISSDHAPCTRPHLPSFSTQSENVTFELKPGVKLSKLAVWYSNFETFNADGSIQSLFERKADIEVTDLKFTLEVRVGSVYTISTILDGPAKGKSPVPVPASQPSVPLPLHDDFEGYETSKEARWWSDQVGAFEVHYESGTAGNKVMQQMVPQTPIGWSDKGSVGPMTLVGMREWQDINISAQFKLPEKAMASAAGCLGTRCNQMWGKGVVFCVFGNGSFVLSQGGPLLGGHLRGQVYARGATLPLPARALSSLSLTTVGSKASATVNGEQVLTDVHVRDIDTGFAVMGASNWVSVQFDNVLIQQAGPHWLPPASPCSKAAVGSALYARPCVPNGLTADDQIFELLSDWGILHVPSGLCVSAPTPMQEGGLTLETCDPNDLKQQFKNDYTNVRNRVVEFSLKAGGGKFLLGGNTSGSVFLVSTSLGALPGVREWKAWSYFPNTRQLRNQYDTDELLGYPMCLSMCGSPPLAQALVI